MLIPSWKLSVRSCCLVLLSALATACGSSVGVGSDQEGLAYEFTENGCKTGSHSFDSRDSYCRALQDSALNRGCAGVLRAKAFEEAECPGRFSDSAFPATSPSIPTPPPPPAPENTPAPQPPATPMGVFQCQSKDQIGRNVDLFLDLDRNDLRYKLSYSAAWTALYAPGVFCGFKTSSAAYCRFQTSRSANGFISKDLGCDLSEMESSFSSLTVGRLDLRPNSATGRLSCKIFNNPALVFELRNCVPQ
jgi:hypothetical protein